MKLTIIKGVQLCTDVLDTAADMADTVADLAVATEVATVADPTVAEVITVAMVITVVATVAVLVDDLFTRVADSSDKLDKCRSTERQLLIDYLRIHHEKI